MINPQTRYKITERIIDHHFLSTELPLIFNKVSVKIFHEIFMLTKLHDILYH